MYPYQRKAINTNLHLYLRDNRSKIFHKNYYVHECKVCLKIKTRLLGILGVNVAIDKKSCRHVTRQ